MPSPFPGMDPYLEGYLGPDIHHRLASRISAQLAPLLAPRYVARIVVRTIVEALESGETVGVMLPNVEVFGRRRTPDLPASAPTTGYDAAATTLEITPATLTIHQPLTYEVEIASVEIHDVAGGTLIASIEILSPTNKTGVGWDEYQVKRRKVLQAQAHLLEIDWLRRGRRPVHTAGTQRAPYYVFLTRAQRRDSVEVWPIQLRETLPIVPVPLRPPEADVPLDLGLAFRTSYDEARYDLSLDYRQPPNPPFEGRDTEWAQQWLRERLGS